MHVVEKQQNSCTLFFKYSLEKSRKILAAVGCAFPETVTQIVRLFLNVKIKCLRSLKVLSKKTMVLRWVSGKALKEKLKCLRVF